MRLQARFLSLCLSRSVAAMMACVLTLPAHAQELQWIRGGSAGVTEQAAPEVQTSELQTISYAEEYAERPAAPPRIAKQPARRSAALDAVAAEYETDNTVQETGEVVFATALAEARARGDYPDGRVVDDEVQQVGHLGHIGGHIGHIGCSCGGEPGCACVEPGCEFASGGCGCGDEACGGCGEGVDCGGTCFGHGPRGVPICIYLPPIENLVVFGGVQGFKNPLDGFRDRGNFGFNTGFNVGGRLPWPIFHGLGYQLGYRATFNQLNGSQFDPPGAPTFGPGPDGTADAHAQSFFTGGLFHRNPTGFQFGLVYDLLNDERIGSVNFSQVRGELSIRNPKGGEVGFTFSVGTDEELLDITPTTDVDPLQEFQAADQYLAFYRYTAHGGGEARFLAGGDSDSRGIIGADLLAPLNHHWSINTGFRYLIAGDSTAGIGSTQEAWNIGINLVHHFYGTGRRWHTNPYRPLFDVADNGSFSVDENN